MLSARTEALTIVIHYVGPLVNFVYRKIQDIFYSKIKDMEVEQLPNLTRYAHGSVKELWSVS